MREKVIGADNQQGSRRNGDPSETIRRAPLIKAYLLGALHDGTFSSNKRFRISQKGIGWLDLLRKLFHQLGYNSWIYKEGKYRKVYVLETLADFLNFNFDPLRLSQNDREKLVKIKKLLNDLKVKTGKIHNPSQSVDPDYWRMYVLAKSQQSFLEKIGTWHPRKIETLRKRMMI